MQGLATRLPLLALLAVPVLAAAWFSYESLAWTWREFIAWIYGEQRAFHQHMTEGLSALADRTGVSTASTVVFGSFLYGIFHAAGPGHGKVILSTYLLTQPQSVKKSVMLSALAAFMQGLVAIIIVYGFFYAFGLAARDTKIAVAWSERISFILVAAIGLMLLWRALRGLFPAWLGKKHHGHLHHHAGDHAHAHAHGEGEVCDSCGHAHVVPADLADRARDLRSIISVIVSIGLRPCSGAVLVLIFAKFAGIPLAGVMAVAAISLGTAITVSAIAIFAVQARRAAMSALGAASQRLDLVGNLVALTGGMILLMLGLSLFAGSFSGPVRSMGL